MQDLQNRDKRYDYTYIYEVAPCVERIIIDYIGDKNIKFLDIKEELPDGPERANDVGIIFETRIYDKFNVSLGGGEQCFEWDIEFDELPYGYKFKEEIYMKTLTISDMAVIEPNDDDYYDDLSFSPTEKNIKIMLKYLVNYLEYLTHEKEQNPNLTYYEIGELRRCDEKGWVYTRGFNNKFEKIDKNK